MRLDLTPAGRSRRTQAAALAAIDIDPHEVSLALEPEGDAVEAMVSRVVHLGSQVRVDLELAGGGQARAQLTTEKAEELELERSDIVYLKHSEQPAAAAVSA